jgi:hypothetical protein
MGRRYKPPTRITALDRRQRFGSGQIQDATTILGIVDLPDYIIYNANNDIAWGDIHYIESLMNALQWLVSDT